MLSDDKFFEKAQKFALYQNVDDKHFTFEEYLESIKAQQTDKDGNLVVLYAAHKEAQHSYIKKAQNKSYDVLLMEGPLVSHLMQKLEGGDQKVKFARVDSDSVDKLIAKDEEQISLLSEEQKESLKPLIEAQVDKASYTVHMEAMDSAEAPFTITVPEFMVRAGKLGAKSGEGFYDYSEGPKSETVSPQFS